jgi:hypothetical protein
MPPRSVGGVEPFGYQDDELDGANLYRTGDRLEATGSYAFAAGARAAGIVYVGYLRRQEGEFTDEVRIVPAQDLLFGGLGFRTPVGRAVLAPSVDVRLVSRADGAEEGYIATVGASAELPAGTFTIVPSVRSRFGNAVLNTDAESAVTGFDVGVAVRFGGVAARR